MRNHIKSLSPVIRRNKIQWNGNLQCILVFCRNQLNIQTTEHLFAFFSAGIYQIITRMEARILGLWGWLLTVSYIQTKVFLLTSPYLLGSCSSHPTKELKISTYFFLHITTYFSTYNYIFFYIATYFFLLNSLTQEVVIPLNPIVVVILHVFT